MLNKLLLCATVLLSVTLCGCKEEQGETKKIFPEDFGRYEWISPDGVHYWIMNGNRRYGITPRYDNNGNLVIDKLAEDE